MKKNKLVAIGYLGSYKVYLNISKEEAKKRYTDSEEYMEGITIKELDIEDEFWVYDIAKEE